MASKQEIQFWSTLLKIRTGAKESCLDNFLSAVMENPGSFEHFVKNVREATYPEVPERDAARRQMEPDADNRIRGHMLQRPVPRSKKCNGYVISL